MRENIKSCALMLLIVLSLIQSYFLIYRMPGADSVANSEAGYVQAEDIGPRSDIENLVFPDQMIIHKSGNRHTIFYPSSSNYNSIYTDLKNSSFGQFRRLPLQSMNWNAIRSEAGIELTFNSGIPVSLLERSMNLNPDSLFEGDAVNRILIYNAAENNVPRAFFFSAGGDVVYEATDIKWTSQDVLKHVLLGENGINYQYAAGGYYVPQTGLSIPTITLKLDSLTTEQMQRNLFFDPGATRNINEENGTEIYTDSKRSLQVDTRQRWMTYTDPTAPTTGTNSVVDNVLSAVEFVNQHGGWPGTYMLNMSSTDNKKGFTFRQYYHSYPIMDTDKLRFGYMRLMVEYNTVSSYERSLLYLTADQQLADQPLSSNSQIQVLPGGPQLINLLQKQVPAGQTVSNLSPAYRPTLGNGVVVLTPVWMAELQDGRHLLIELNHKL
ncbi:YycH family regulatory protein [Paenibacillus bovis]|uniref:Regulatory protein YycH domain-containing protein n=1 Tax=Paenibacillus bovis TaxID=1616788 RepID=A0A172ZD17_9BACL|nr:two-component system activity regulator YycH [Paenibacillus bovis]ANF95050.1 hypothetical protein AR543_02690 [Paenibacillus bovis]